jgi:hypothetical protein
MEGVGLESNYASDTSTGVTVSAPLAPGTSFLEVGISVAMECGLSQKCSERALKAGCNVS